jgi:hypothetical protein
MVVIVELLYGTQGKRERKGKDNDRASVISYNIRCEGRGYKNVYGKLLKNGCWEVKV